MFKFTNHIIIKKITYFEKTIIFTYLKSKNVIGLAHPQIGIEIEGKELVRFNRVLLEMLHKSTLSGHYIWHDYLLNETT